VLACLCVCAIAGLSLCLARAFSSKPTPCFQRTGHTTPPTPFFTPYALVHPLRPLSTPSALLHPSALVHPIRPCSPPPPLFTPFAPSSTPLLLDRAQTEWAMLQDRCITLHPFCFLLLPSASSCLAFAPSGCLPALDQSPCCFCPTDPCCAILLVLIIQGVWPWG